MEQSVPGTTPDFISGGPTAIQHHTTTTTNKMPESSAMNNNNIILLAYACVISSCSKVNLIHASEWTECRTALKKANT
jgi:hypothetical protein